MHSKYNPNISFFLFIKKEGKKKDMNTQKLFIMEKVKLQGILILPSEVHKNSPHLMLVREGLHYKNWTMDCSKNICMWTRKLNLT